MTTKTIFVFGSNLAGKHGRGSALEAWRNRGAEYGIGKGLVGNSYAIPTKDNRLKTLPLDEIEVYVREFIEYAREHPEWMFYLVAIGCGLAGYNPEQIAPMFRGASPNCVLPLEFLIYLAQNNAAALASK